MKKPKPQRMWAVVERYGTRLATLHRTLKAARAWRLDPETIVRVEVRVIERKKPRKREEKK